MLLPLLVIGVVAFLVGRAHPAAPAIGALGPGMPPGPRATARPGDRVRLELGRPYRIVLTSLVPPGAQRKLLAWLTLGTYRARELSVRRLPSGLTELALTFFAPKTETVPIGQPLDWDLGDGRLRLVLRSVTRLDGAPVSIAGSSRRLAELRARAKAEIAIARALGRPTGPAYARAMQRAMELQTRGQARPSEIPALFDDLRSEVGVLDPQPLDERIPSELLDTF